MEDSSNKDWEEEKLRFTKTSQSTFNILRDEVQVPVLALLRMVEQRRKFRAVRTKIGSLETPCNVRSYLRTEEVCQGDQGEAKEEASLE